VEFGFNYIVTNSSAVWGRSYYYLAIGAVYKYVRCSHVGLRAQQRFEFL